MNSINNNIDLASLREEIAILLDADTSREDGNDPEGRERVNLGIVHLARMFAFGTEKEKQEILVILRSQTENEEEFQQLIRQLEFFAQREIGYLQQTIEKKNIDVLIKEKNHLKQIKQILENARDDKKLFKELVDCIVLIIGGMPIEEVCLNLEAEIQRINFILSSMKERNKE